MRFSVNDVFSLTDYLLVISVILSELGYQPTNQVNLVCILLKCEICWKQTPPSFQPYLEIKITDMNRWLVVSKSALN